jgi:spore coat protein A
MSTRARRPSMIGARFTGALFVLATVVLFALPGPAAATPVPGGSLDPRTIPKYVQPLVIPPAMPRTSVLDQNGTQVDYYEIAVKQFSQFILPQSWAESRGMKATTVWSYASMTDPRPAAQGGTLNYPAFTVEALTNRPVRIKWINGLVDANGDYLPHLFAVDQTLHWANPPGGTAGRDGHGMEQAPYTGPVPMTTHVHGAHTTEWSDGFPEAWYLPAARDIPAGYASTGTYYDRFKAEAETALGQKWAPGTAVFQYPGDQRPTTLWYHDHTLGMTRLNVYAGPAGFYLLRSASDPVAPQLPGPAPQRGDAPGTSYREIPIVIQDRSFNSDGSLFYPGNRAFFEGLNVPGQAKQFPGAGFLRIPFVPDKALGGKMSDISPIWNPEFFGNTMVVNGRAWPYLNVEQRRYRLRFLNGSEARFLILKMSDGSPFWQIGNEGGYLPKPVRLTQLLIAPAERADVIVDFTNKQPGTQIVLRNTAPDEPYGGGRQGKDYVPSDPRTTGQVMQFRVVPRVGTDTSTPPSQLQLPVIAPLPKADRVRDVSINELVSSTVKVRTAGNNVVLSPKGAWFGPREAALGTWTKAGGPRYRFWGAPVTENPATGSTEIWNIRNFTEDAHPIHIHQVQFQVIKRTVVDPEASPHGNLGRGAVMKPQPWELGRKDTVIVYPGELTQIKATFDIPGLFVWHCHILEHEDNEMMRPLRVGPAPKG